MQKRCAADAALAPGRTWQVVLALGYGTAWLALWFASYQLNLVVGISVWFPAAGLTFAICSNVEDGPWRCRCWCP